jgi:hypothetical protein
MQSSRVVNVRDGVGNHLHNGGDGDKYLDDQAKMLNVVLLVEDISELEAHEPRALEPLAEVRLLEALLSQEGDNRDCMLSNWRTGGLQVWDGELACKALVLGHAATEECWKVGAQC